MNRKSYDAALNMLRSQRTMENKLDEIGFNFEYGEGVVGAHFQTILNNCEDIIKESLGLHSVSKAGVYKICEQDYPVNIDILYTKDEDEDFSITEDDFCEFCFKVIDDSEIGEALQELAWKALAEKNAVAKDRFNEVVKRIMIGPLPN